MKPIQWMLFALPCLLVIGSFNPLLAVDEKRQAYDKMVEEATREADEYLQEKENQTKAAEEKTQTQRNSAMEERVQAERERIEAEMDAIGNRGLGSGFTQGMRDNLLQQQREKLDQLTSDPEAYFGAQ